MIENHQEKENDADDIAEHGQLDIRDHLFAIKFFLSGTTIQGLNVSYIIAQSIHFSSNINYNLKNWKLLTITVMN